MHPLLEHLSIFTWMDVLGSKEKCISFLEELELVPKKTDPTPKCPKCSGPMTVVPGKSYILGWKWSCKKRNIRETGCYATINSLRGTIFEKIRIPLKDMLALMFGYLVKMCFSDIKEHLICWRRQRNDIRWSVSDETIGDFYAKFDEVIMFALSQEGVTLKDNENISREKLFKKYAKTKNIRLTFRNFLFQFLMDIKSMYPYVRNCENEDKSASINEADSTNGNISVVNETSNKTASTSTVPPCNMPVISDGLIANIDSCKNSSLSDCPSTFIAAENNFNKNKHNTEIANVEKLNTSVSFDSCTPNTTFFEVNVISNSSSPSTNNDNIIFNDDLNRNIENVELENDILASINLQITENYIASNVKVCKISNIEACKTSNMKRKTSNSEVCKASNIKTRKTSNNEACITSNITTRKTSNIEVCKTLNTEACKTSNIEAYKTNIEACKTSNTETCKTSNTEACRTSHIEAHKTSNIEAHKTSNIEARKTSNTEAHKTLNTEARKTLNTEAHKTLNTEARKTSNTETCKISHIEAHETSNIEALKTSNIEARKTSNIETHKTSNIVDRKTSNMKRKTSNSEVCKTSNIKTRKTSNNEACITSNIKTRKTSNIEVCKTSNTEACKTSNIEACKTSHIEARKTSNVEARKTSNVEARKTSNTEAHRTSNIEVCKTSNTEACKISNIEDCKTSNIEARKTSNIEVCKTSNIKGRKTDSCKTSKLSNCSNTSIAKEIAFNKMENNVELENVISFNESTSYGISATGNIVSLNENCIPNCPSIYNNINGVKYNHGLIMEVDHTETVITIDDD